MEKKKRFQKKSLRWILRKLFQRQSADPDKSRKTWEVIALYVPELLLLEREHVNLHIFMMSLRALEFLGITLASLSRVASVAIQCLKGNYLCNVSIIYNPFQK